MLGEPMRIGAADRRNRVVFSAHLTDAAVDGLPTAQHAAYYAARAAGGAGLVITEEHSVDPADRPYEKLVRGTTRPSSPGYRAITAAVHAHGVPVLAQLNHNGGQSSAMYSRRPVWAPSAVPDPMFREVPRALTEAGIRGSSTGTRWSPGTAPRAGSTASSCSARTPRSCGSCSRADDRRRAASRSCGGWSRRCAPRSGPSAWSGSGCAATRACPAGLDRRRRRADGAASRPSRLLNTAIGVATATLHLIEASMGVPPGYAVLVPAAVRRRGLGAGDRRRAVHHARRRPTRGRRVGHCDLVGVVRGQIADPAFAATALAEARVRRASAATRSASGGWGSTAGSAAR